MLQAFICLRHRTPYPPTLTHCVPVYSILIHTGKGGAGGRGEPQRTLEGKQFTMLGQKYQSINSDKHLPRSIFLDEDMLPWCLYS
jgi:hypothetical protein